ncbi:AEC family transporter [Clostridium chauvoei]|uniref:AEC family transporter n=1 Tax=Clostridium chauvoei TaxID=46867 RepID=UPI001C856BE1|nr:AEC family transporter [Clostridium chauvoei]MBX7409748.1 AEC family transporter [Clostridium chauvoei]
MELEKVLMKVISVFLIILIGVYGSKKNIITESLQEGLKDLIINITFPFLVLTSFSFSYDSSMLSSIVKAFIYSLLSFIILIGINYIFIKPVSKEKRFIMKLSNVFSNCSFIGMIAIESIFGAEGMIYAGIFNMTFYSLIWIYTKYICIKNKVEKNLNPTMLAICIGLFMIILKIQLPVGIYNSFSIIGEITTPIGLILVGSIISKINLKVIFSDYTLYYAAFIKLIVMPLIILGVSKLLKDDSMVICTIILLQAMPSSEISTIFAKEYAKDYKYSSELVVISTLLFILTFPIILKLVV